MSATQPESPREAVTVARRERTLLAIAAAFVLVGSTVLVLANPELSLKMSAASGIFVLSFGAAHVLLNRLLPRRDPYLAPISALLAGWGLLLAGRLAPAFLVRQLIWLPLSLAVLLVVVRFRSDLRWLRRYRYTWLLGGLALLGVTFVLGVNPSGYGPRLWLGAFGLYFQPSELLKLLLVVYLASYLAERRGLIVSTRWRIGRYHLPPLAYVGPLGAMFGLAAVLLAWQQDLGAAMLYYLIVLAMLYLATNQWAYVAVGLGCFLLVGAAGYALSDTVALRVDAWINPWPEAADRAFQVVQSLLAFAAGGILGQGLGLGIPTYIPAVHTDFVFAAIGEEFGLAGTLATIALYAALMLRGFYVALRVERPFERFLAAGLTVALVVQAWVIMAGNAKLVPITGVTLPFVSYGGSSLLISYLALALLLSVSELQSSGYISPRLSISEPGDPFHVPLARLAAALTVALCVLAGTCGYWAVARAAQLQARYDNPRRVLYEQRIVRGTVVDRNEVTLAITEVGSDGFAVRHYPVPEAAPVVGYASLRHGTGGIESALDVQLRGEAGQTAWQALQQTTLHRAPHGEAVQLTLDAELQVLAQQALNGSVGAVVLIDARSGEVLAMASSPTFDPEQLDDNWEALRDDVGAPLLNRATQGLYQPGATIQTMVLAEALNRNLADLDAAATAPEDVMVVNGTQLSCHPAAVRPSTLSEAYALSCPTPFAELGELLGAEGLSGMVERWGLATPPSLEIPTESADWSADVVTTTQAARAEATGQGELTLSPLQMALVAATLANDGVVPTPYLVLGTRGENGGWQPLHTGEETPRRILSSAVAGELLASWSHYGSDVAGHWGLAVAGSGLPPHAWFIGTAVGDEPDRYAVAVLIEHAKQPDAAVSIGTALLRAATNAN